MGRARLFTTGALATCLTASAIWVAFAGATHHRYPVDAVTIKVNRATKTLSGKVLADSTVVHFCTSSNDWPVNIRMARPGRDKKVAHTRTNFDAKWRFRVRSAGLRGKRLYAQVPSFPNAGHGYCVGARSRAVRAP
jgi:hypothetical protein